MRASVPPSDGLAKFVGPYAGGAVGEAADAYETANDVWDSTKAGATLGGL
jgi:hypothetical protein